MTITALLVDDEKNNLSNLSRLLNLYCPMVHIVGEALDAAEAKTHLLRLNPDLVFLDIQMPGTNGLELLQQLPEPNFELIFVTAHDQYGIQAVKFAAVDYLLKPIDIAELQAAVRKVAERLTVRHKNAQLENLLQLLHQQKNKDEHRLPLTTLKETRFVQTARIIRCESSNNYCYFFLDSGEKLLVSKPIYEYDPLLAPYGFIRCHQSHLVNKRYIRSWVRENGGFLLLENGDSIPVSRNKKEAVLKTLGF